MINQTAHLASRACRAASLAVCFALVACSSAPAPDSASQETVGTVTSAEYTTTSGAAYASLCSSNGVPLPPEWGPNLGWNYNGSYNDGFTGFMGCIYYAKSSSGICVANYCGPHNQFDIICQGTNGNACFWESNTDPTTLPAPPSGTPVALAPPGSQPVVYGGTGLNDNTCTMCHAGENVFLTHDDPGHATNLIGTLGWMPSAWYQPIIASGPPDNPGPQSFAGYPTSTSNCLTCHTSPASGGTGGRFPSLSQMQSVIDGTYCSILAYVVNHPSSQGGMPPGNTCTPWSNCAAQTDPFVQAMLINCGFRGTWAGPMGGNRGSMAGVSAQGIAPQGGNIWGVDIWNDIYYWNATTQSWLSAGFEPNCCSHQAQVVASGSGATGGNDGIAWVASGVANYRLECNISNGCGTSTGATVLPIGGNALHGIVSPAPTEAWGIDQYGTLNHSGNLSAFQQIGSAPGSLYQIAMSPDYDGGSGCSTLWLLTTNENLYKCSDTHSGSTYTYTFTQVQPPSGYHPYGVAVADANNVWIIPQSGDVGAFKYTGSGWTSYFSGAAFVQIVAGPSLFPEVPAEVWAFDGSGYVYRLFGNSFAYTGGVVVNNSSLTQRLSVASEGTDDIWAIGTDSNVYNY
jgi:hypothetical protein